MIVAHSLLPSGSECSRTDYGAGIWCHLPTGVHWSGRHANSATPLSRSSLRAGTGRMKGSTTEALEHFRGRQALRSPQIEADRPDHEIIQIEAEFGLRLLGTAPAHNVLFGYPPTSRTETGPNRYLWVIDERGIPYILEEPLAEISSNLPKHTNLTGGGRAYLGGEMWFASSMKMCVSGGSGRYPPVDRQQLEDAVQVLRSFGYDVDSLGWDDEYGARRNREDSP